MLPLELFLLMRFFSSDRPLVLATTTIDEKASFCILPVIGHPLTFKYTNKKIHKYKYTTIDEN